jgi:hypothetical protein
MMEVEERISHEKIAKVRCLKGRVMGIADYTDKEAIIRAVTGVIERAYEEKTLSLYLQLDVEVESIPSLEYTVEQIILPEERKKANDET